MLQGLSATLCGELHLELTTKNIKNKKSDLLIKNMLSKTSTNVHTLYKFVLCHVKDPKVLRAICKKHPEIVYVKDKTNHNNTLMHMFASQRNRVFMHILRSHGASSFRKNSKGFSPIDILHGSL